tara:strand:- start:730 stop:891 length:162 start_codon:yes stop_codon:yes gene_type:complete
VVCALNEHFVGVEKLVLLPLESNADMRAAVAVQVNLAAFLDRDIGLLASFNAK